MRPKIGTAPVNWNNRDAPQPGPPVAYARMLDEMAAAGYAGTEYGTEFPREPDRVRDDLTTRGLIAASSFLAVNLRDRSRWSGEIDKALELARVLRALGEELILIADDGDERREAAAGQVDSSVALGDEAWAVLTEGLQTLAARVAEVGVRVALHNHVGTYIETEVELRRALDQTDPALVSLCLDVGHLLYGGGSVQGIAEAYQDRISYVHLKDVDPVVLARCRRERLGFHDALRLGIFPELGQGSVDFARFLGLLDARDYGGWLIVEQDTTMKTPFESAALNRAFLRERFGL